MLNSVLTVERGRAGSHQGKGWELLPMQSFRSLIDDRCRGISVMGAQAQRKGATIDSSRHCVLAAPHPSPLSAHRGFWGAGISVRPIASSWSIIAARWTGLVLRDSALPM